jgi:serine/threonine protein phosphatase PrpC
MFVLEQAFKKVTAVGSSTALLAVLNNKHVHLANLGDSGFVFYR